MGYPLKLIIYTDLNDTLLDTRHGYNFKAAEEALEKVREREIPLIICTSKSRAQTEIYRQALDINFPLIVENGSAIFFPHDSFPTGRREASIFGY